MKNYFPSHNILSGARMVLWTIGKRAFSAILIFILLDIISGALLIYLYIIIPQNKGVQLGEKPLKINEDTYQKIIGQQEQNQQYLQNILEKEAASTPEPSKQPEPSK
jgi:hypothetical protein